MRPLRGYRKVNLSYLIEKFSLYDPDGKMDYSIVSMICSYDLENKVHAGLTRILDGSLRKISGNLNFCCIREEGVAAIHP